MAMWVNRLGVKLIGEGSSAWDRVGPFDAEIGQDRCERALVGVSTAHA
jgi:hypothetical protein